MEKYFIVKNKDLIERMKKYDDSLDKIEKIFETFREKYGIETTKFYLDDYIFSIVPTPNDKEKFKKEFKKNRNTFKSDSIISKDWVNTCKENNINTSKPTNRMWQMICSDAYKVSTRLFSYEGLIYGSFETNRDFELNPDDFEELKPSEFYTKIGE